MKYESLTLRVSLGIRTVVLLNSNYSQYIFDVSLPISKQQRWLTDMDLQMWYLRRLGLHANAYHQRIWSFNSECMQILQWDSREVLVSQQGSYLTGTVPLWIALWAPHSPAMIRCGKKNGWRIWFRPLTMRLMGHVQAPSLEVSKIRQKRALSNLVWPHCWPCFEQQIGPDWLLGVPFNLN